MKTASCSPHLEGHWLEGQRFVDCWCSPEEATWPPKCLQLSSSEIKKKESSDAPLSAPRAASSPDSPLPSSVPLLAGWEPGGVETESDKLLFSSKPYRRTNKLSKVGSNRAPHLDLEFFWVLEMDVTEQPAKSKVWLIRWQKILSSASAFIFQTSVYIQWNYI